MTIDKVIEAGEKHVNSKDYVTALEVFKSAMNAAKFTEAQNSRILMNMALCHINVNEDIAAKEIFIKWQNQHKHDTHEEAVKKLLVEYENALQEFNASKGEDLELKALKEKLDTNPENIQLVFDIATHCYNTENYEECIDFLLDVIAIDRNWNDRAAHKQLLEVFNKLGTNNEIVKEARKKLTKVLF